MGSFRHEPARFDLDKELQRAEEGSAVRVLRESVESIQPDSAFAERLESRLRAGEHAATDLRASANSTSLRTRSGVAARPALRMWLLGTALAASVVAVFWLSVVSQRGVGGIVPVGAGASGTPLPTTLPAGVGSGGEFVPAGKVRHMILVHTTYAAATPQLTSTDWIDEVWIANGQQHYMMRLISTSPDSTRGKAADLLVGNSNAWAYYPKEYWQLSMGDTTEDFAYKMRYDARLLDGFVPDKEYIQSLKGQPNVTVHGGQMLDNIQVNTLESDGNAEPHVWIYAGSEAQWSPMQVLIFSRYNPFLRWSVAPWDRPTGIGWATPIAQITPIVKIDAGGPAQDRIDYVLWVTQDDRVVQQEYVIKPSARSTAGERVNKVKLVVDELLDESAVPADLFSFDVPEGVKTVNAMPVFTGLQVQALSGGHAEPSNWKVFNAPSRDFSLLMPSSAPNVNLNHGWRVFEAAQDGVTYGAAYKDVDTAPDGAAAAQWLGEQVPDVEVSMDGEEKSRKAITLDAYPGLEIGIQKADQTFARARVYVVGKRLYNIYAVAPSEKSAYSQELNLSLYLGSLTLLKK
jgi:hypothetical protein